MELYSYLEDKCVKCFYEISFYKTGYEIDNNKSGITYISGNSNHFKIGDKLPLKTNFYYYPDTFYIYDYTSDDLIIHFIENEVYKGYQSIHDITLNPDKIHVINLNGLEILDIKNKEDFFEISKHWKECVDKSSSATSRYFPQGTLSMFMSNTTKYNELKPKLDKEIEEIFKEFQEIWVKDDVFYIEKKYGELLEVVKASYWEIKGDSYLTDEEKVFELSSVYEELDVFSQINPDAKIKYLKLFDFIPNFYPDNIISMVEKFLKY